MNEGACKLLGAGPDALVGRGLGELGIVPSLNGPGARAVMDSISAGEARTYEDQRVDSGGLLRALELSVAVREIDQQLYLMVAARDLSVRKEMENRLIQADLLARIGSLAAGVAHEINNPLACILSNLHHLSSRIGERPALAPGDEAELVGVIRESIEAAGRARDIVRDLSWLSPREQRGPEPVDVSALLHSCINVAMSAIRPRATLLSVPGNVPPVLGDRARLAQVFLNLLVNAAEAIPEGDAAAQRISVSTSFDRADGMVRIDVADTGRGIPAAISSRIFDPFFTTKPFGRGTGLGLSICHGIVTALGGRISVRSREGEGSTFSVSLPSLPPET